MKKINVAIVGVGSFAKALVEGVSYYTKNPNEQRGLINPVIGGYRVRDINFVAAFDVDERKVGKKLHQAVAAGSNVTVPIADPLEYDAIVYRGPTMDGVVDEMKGLFVRESRALVADVAKVLKESKADVVLNLVPTGSEQATYFYAKAALKAGCGFINCIPTALATDLEWKKRFENAELVLLGDDLKSQLGATMLNRFLLSLFNMRGIAVSKSEQENRGGNADHFNLQYRAKAKEKSKRDALTCFLKQGDVVPKVTFAYTGEPTGHKRVDLTIEGELFARIPIRITSVIEDEISVNGAGVAVDAIRMAKSLIDIGKQKESWRVCPFLMKSVTYPMTDEEAFEEFNKVLKS